jgi:hypothetical protein
MQGNFSGAVGLVNWSAKPDRPLSLTAAVRMGTLPIFWRSLAREAKAYSGPSCAVSMWGEPWAIQPAPRISPFPKASVAQEPFDDLRLQVTLADRVIRVPSAFVSRDKSRVELTAEFQHPRESLNTAISRRTWSAIRWSWAVFEICKHDARAWLACFQVNATMEGDLAATREFRLTRDGRRPFGERRPRGRVRTSADVSAKSSTSGGAVSYNLTSNFAARKSAWHGRTELKEDYPTNLDATISSLPVQRVSRRCSSGATFPQRAWPQVRYI